MKVLCRPSRVGSLLLANVRRLWKLQALLSLYVPAEVRVQAVWQHEAVHRSPHRLAVGPARGEQHLGDVPSRLLCSAGHSPDERSSPLGAPGWLSQ